MEGLGAVLRLRRLWVLAPFWDVQPACFSVCMCLLPVCANDGGACCHAD